MRAVKTQKDASHATGSRFSARVALLIGDKRSTCHAAPTTEVGFRSTQLKPYLSSHGLHGMDTYRRDSGSMRCKELGDPIISLAYNRAGWDGTKLLGVMGHFVLHSTTTKSVSEYRGCSAISHPHYERWGTGWYVLHRPCIFLIFQSWNPVIP